MNTKTNSNLYFSEITQSSLHTWKAQCWKWNDFPTFGGLVTTTHNDITTYGIITSIHTGSLDPIRQPVAYQKTEEELLHEQPQIFQFLTTTFQCITVGFCQNSPIFYQLPPHPPKIHSFVGNAQRSEYEKFFSSDQFLHSLFNHSAHIGTSLDELLLAIIRHIAQENLLTSALLVQFIESFSMLNKNDYKKLKVFTNRIEYLLKNSNPKLLEIKL